MLSLFVSMSNSRHLLLSLVLLLSVSYNIINPCVSFLVRPARQAEPEAPPETTSQATVSQTERNWNDLPKDEQGSGVICCMPRLFESRQDSLLALSPLPRPRAPPMPQAFSRRPSSMNGRARSRRAAIRTSQMPREHLFKA